MSDRFSSSPLLICAFAFALTALTASPCAQAQSTHEATDAEARGLFLAGQAAYATSRYDDALRYFRQAYELSRRPQLLYNIAVAADRLRRDEEALAAFEQFVRDTPEDTPQRRDAEARIPVLREAIARARAQSETPEPPAEPVTDDTADDSTVQRELPVLPSAPERHRSVAPWVLTGVGAALTVGGVITYTLGRRDAARVTDASDGASWASVDEAARRARPEMTIGLVLLGVGVASAAGGITWAIAGNEGDEQAASAELRVVPNGLVVTGAF